MELLISNGSDRIMPRGQLGMRKIRLSFQSTTLQEYLRIKINICKKIINVLE